MGGVGKKVEREYNRWPRYLLGVESITPSHERAVL